MVQQLSRTDASKYRYLETAVSLGHLEKVDGSMKINLMFPKLLARWRWSKKIVSEELTTYDPAEDLTSDEAIETFMAEAFKAKDTGFIAYADGIVARARAKDTPADGIVARAKDMMKALGIKLKVEGLYSQRPWLHLGLLASVAVAVVAGGWAVYLVRPYQDNAITAANGGVVIRCIQSSPTMQWSGNELLLPNTLGVGMKQDRDQDLSSFLFPGMEPDRGYRLGWWYE